MSPNVVALSLLLAASPFGAFDSFYFHTLKFRLYERSQSRIEEMTHLARSVLIGTVAVVLSRGEPHGAWYWLVSGLLVADFFNNVGDAISEPASRKSLGGLPPLEYVIHIIGASMTGGASAAFILLGWPMASLPTALAPAAAMPAWLANAALGMGATVVLLAAAETALFVRAWRRQAAQSVTP